jgi:RNA recognition motif. (a.k.a. RRM, RBD, or RNP domain)
MENQSSPNPNRRRRSNRSGGRNRNRQGSSGNSGQRSSSAPPTGQGSSRNSRNRNRSGERIRRNTPKPSLVQRILSFLSFGLLGKKSKKKQAPAARKPQTTRSTQGPGKSEGQSRREPSQARRDASTADLSQKRRSSTTEVTTPRLYVGNLDFAATEGELEDLFRGVGLVSSTEVVINSRTQQSKGFAFVEMGSVEEAKRAVAVLDNQDFMGRKLIVGGARSDGPKDGSNNDETPSLEVAAD